MAKDDLNSSITKPLVIDKHFGLSKEVWSNTQTLIDQLPIDIILDGDLPEETVLDMTSQANGADLQEKHWGEYKTQALRYLTSLVKIKQHQAEVAKGVVNAQLQHTEIEKELGESLAELEAKRRLLIANNRTAIQSTQDKLALDVEGIQQKYLAAKTERETRTKEQAKLERNATPYQKQILDLRERFRERRGARTSV